MSDDVSLFNSEQARTVFSKMNPESGNNELHLSILCLFQISLNKQGEHAFILIKHSFKQLKFTICLTECYLSHGKMNGSLSLREVSLMRILSRYHPSPTPFPSCPATTLSTFPRSTAWISNTSTWKKSI